MKYFKKIVLVLLYILGLVLLTFLPACNKGETIYNTGVDIRSNVTKRVWVAIQKPNVELSIDTRLSKDINGYSYFNLYSMDKQNFHRISGTILVNGKTPKPSQGAEWESNLYWWIGKNDTIVSVTKTAVIPTINKNSQSDISTGEINTIIAPMWEMRGDTMIVVCKVKYFYPYETDGISEKYKMDSITKIEKIILK